MYYTARLTCVLALGAIALSAQIIPLESVETTAMIGIASGQTARLNLLNPGVLPPALGVVCTAGVQYRDADGNVLKTASVAVAPGQAVGVLLHSDTDLALVSNGRREIRATITIPLIPPPTAAAGTPPTPACRLVSNLEIFDTLTGRTQASVGKVVSVE